MYLVSLLGVYDCGAPVWMILFIHTYFSCCDKLMTHLLDVHASLEMNWGFLLQWKCYWWYLNADAMHAAAVHIAVMVMVMVMVELNEHADYGDG